MTLNNRTKIKTPTSSTSILTEQVKMIDNKNNILDDDRIGLLLFKLSLPAFFGLAVMALYNVVDTVFIGRYVGPIGIAALTIVFPIQMLAVGIGQMTGMGSASIISRLIGAGRISRAESTLGNGITAAILSSIAILVAGLISADHILKMMGASEATLPLARDYLIIILFGIFFQISAMTLNFSIRSEGNARISMIGMIIGALLNIVLDAIFIVRFGMGVKGAAIATVIAQFVSMLYFIVYYLFGKGLLKVHLKNLLIRWEILRAILAIGVASFARTIATSLSVIFINRVLLSYGGDMAVTVYGITNRVVMFAIIPPIVISEGLQPILGFNYGAKRYDRALRALRLAILTTTVCCVVAFLIIYLFPEVLILIFTNDSMVVAMGTHATRRMFPLLSLVGFIMVGSITFQSIGKATYSFITAVSRSVLFLLPSVLILPHYFQLDGVWLAFPVTDALSFLMVMMLLIPQLKELNQSSTAK